MPIEQYFNFIMGNHSLTQKITCSPMIKLKNSSLGIKQQQSLTHSKNNLFSHDKVEK
jgi:hypothetical protein